jgi:sugar/nucleoside kinase (ribokinase family)
MKYDVYGIGNALVDFLLFVDDDYLSRQNVAKGVMTLVGEPVAERLAAAAEGDIIMCSGGSAANTIVGLAAAGGSGCYCGKVGGDRLGEFYRDDLKKLGVDLFGSCSHLPTGSCASLVTPDGERSMLTHLGASTTLESSDIDADAIKESSYIYLEGYLWDSESARQASVSAMEIARKHGVKIAFSFSDPFLIDRFRDDFLHISREYVDLLFCNDQEATMITEVDEPILAAAKLGKMTERICVTLGSDGAVVVDQSTARQTPALPVSRAVDTTGAGDLYAAGVLRGLTLGLDLVSSSLIGARLAGAIVETIGARLTRESLNRW